MVKLIIFFVLCISFIFCYKRPGISFWIMLSLFFDPGGFFSYYFEGKVIGPLAFSDVFFFLMAMSFFRMKFIHFIPARKNTHFYKLTRYFIFLLIYYYIIVLYITPLSHGRTDELSNFIKGREQIYGLFMMLMVYKVGIKYGWVKLFKTIVYTAIITILLFFFSWISGIHVLPVMTLERYAGADMLRVYMQSYGLIHWIFGLGIIIYLCQKSFSLKISNKFLIYGTLLLFLMVQLLTLTRRVYLELVITPFIILFVFWKLTGRRIQIKNVLKSSIVILVFLAIIFPGLTARVSTIVSDAFLLVLTGKDTEGRADYRRSGDGDLDIAKEYIAQNFIWGYGYYYFNYEDKNEGKLGLKQTKIAVAADAATEVPIFSVFFFRGLVGFLLYLPVYYFVILFCFRSFKLLRKYFILLLSFDAFTVFLSMYCFMFFIQLFTIRIYTLFGSFMEPMFMLHIGILYASYYRMKNRICQKIIANE